MTLKYFELITIFDYNFPGVLFPLYYSRYKYPLNQHFLVKRNKVFFASTLTLQQENNLNEKKDKNPPSQIKIRGNIFPIQPK